MNSKSCKKSNVQYYSSFKDIGAGLVLSTVRFSPSIQQRKQVYNVNANDVGVVHNEWMNPLRVYRCLLKLNYV